MITRLTLRALSSSPVSRIAIRPSPACRNLRTQSSQSSGWPSLLQHVRKSYSTSPPPPTAIPKTLRPTNLRSQFATPLEPQTVTQPTPKRSLRPYIYATFFLLLGLTAGQYVRLIIAPPALPPPGSKEDQSMVEFLQKEGEKLAIVQSLSTDPSWEFHDAYTALADNERPNRLTTGPLGGARALGGFQRIFHNKESGEHIAVIWFGGAIAGWPGVTHGGVVATIMDEQLGRCAVSQFPSRTGVTANLEIKYLKPVVTNSYYVIRTFPQQASSTNTKGWVTGRLETLEGRVCVESKALFVVPKNFKTKTIESNF